MSEPQKNLPPQNPPPPAFPVREGALAAQLGITRDVIRYLRQQHLQEGVHFVRRAKKIHYSAEAIGLLRERLDLPPGELQRLLQASREEKRPPTPPDSPPARERANTAQPAPITLKVWRSFSTKKPDGTLKYNGVLECYKPGTDPEAPANLVRVTCRSGENYVRHMEIPARHIAGDVYECARPDPRWRGCW